jgi:hemerythrin-like domain-containing protein
MTRPLDETPAVRETSVVHDVHRRATSLLAEVLDRPSAAELPATELRDFVVATLRHHHQSEDGNLWPIITTNAPELEDALRAMTEEHGQLDASLDALEAAAIADADRIVARDRAVVVRDLVHGHLSHEEPILFPALRRAVSESAWEDFSIRTVASAPSEGKHLLVALLDDVGSAPDVELVLRHVPIAARALLPVAREQGRESLAALHPEAMADRF